jgi:hypothetical protein
MTDASCAGPFRSCECKPKGDDRLVLAPGVCRGNRFARGTDVQAEYSPEREETDKPRGMGVIADIGHSGGLVVVEIPDIGICRNGIAGWRCRQPGCPGANRSMVEISASASAWQGKGAPV